MKAKYVIAGIIVVAGLFIFFNLNSTFLYNELSTLDLVPKSERLTELYFNDSANLPASAQSNQAIQFAFVIHNLEAADYRYIYQVSIITVNTHYIVDRGEVVVKNNQYYVRNERVRLLSPPGKQEVLVELVNKHESIDFYCSVLPKKQQ